MVTEFSMTIDVEQLVFLPKRLHGGMNVYVCFRCNQRLAVEISRGCYAVTRYHSIYVSVLALFHIHSISLYNIEPQLS